MCEGADGVGQAGRGEREALANFQRRRGVIDADQDQRALAGALGGGFRSRLHNRQSL